MCQAGFSHTWSGPVPPVKGDPCDCGLTKYEKYEPAPVAPPTTAGPIVTFDDIEIRTALNNLKAGRVTVRCVIDWLRERGVRVLPDAGKGE
jgi:hypothetical protein